MARSAGSETPGIPGFRSGCARPHYSGQVRLSYPVRRTRGGLDRPSPNSAQGTSMASQTIGTEDTPEGANKALRLSLPDWLANLIDPRVMAKHDQKVQERINDGLKNTVLRRRCAGVVANYLLEEYGDD